MNRMKLGKTNTWLIIIFVVLAICPLIFLGRYNYMCADDYAYGIVTHETWEETDSLIATVISAGKDTASRYYSWQGTFSSIFLMTLNPAIFNKQLACLTPIIMVAILTLSTILFIRNALKNLFDAPSEIWAPFALLLVFLELETTYSPVEAFYWYNGATHYLVMYSLMLFFFSCELSVWNSAFSKKKRIVSTILGMVLSIAIGGGNYLTALLTDIVMTAIVLFAFVKREHRIQSIAQFILFNCAFGISVMAPGNSVRQANANGMHPINAILHSFPESARFLKNSMSPMLIVVMVALIPLIWRLLDRIKSNFRFPLLIFAFSYCIWTSMFTPLLFGVGDASAGRALNIIRYTLYLILIMDWIWFCGWVRLYLEKEPNEIKSDLKTIGEILKKHAHLCMGMGIILIVLVWIGTDDKNTFSSISAMRSLVKGEASQFYAEQMERDRILESSESEVVYLSKISVKPKLLYFTDIVEDEDPNYWINKNMARYYGIEEVHVKIDEED